MTAEGRSQLLSEQEQADLAEMVRLMDEAYTHYFAVSDGHCKSSEGYFALTFDNFFDRRAGKPRSVGVEVYSYVLGPHRTHHFDSPAAALAEVREWHMEMLSRFCYECEGTTEHEAGCWIVARDAASENASSQTRNTP
jgi:hypothetical protein